MRSLRSRLLLVWGLSLAAAAAVGVLLVHVVQQSSGARADRAADAVERACEEIADRYAYYVAGWAGPADPAVTVGQDPRLRRDLHALARVALAVSPGVAGGLWQADRGVVAAVGPDAGALAGRLKDSLAAAVAGALRDERPAAARIAAGTGLLVLTACPLSGPLPGLAGWAMARVDAAPGDTALRAGVGVLLVLVVGTTLAVTWLLAAWTRHLGAIERGLARQGAGSLPRLALTGERELDRIVAALNVAGDRLDAARRDQQAMAARVATAERLAALGRVAAGVAHEIRNPIAAMRLKAEGGLAGDDARRRAALETILAQIARLDRLLSELLAMTQRRAPDLAPLDAASVLEACAADHRDAAAAAGVTLSVAARDGVVLWGDRPMLARALDNLVQNALRHTPRGGRVTLSAAPAADCVEITVADTGPGVAEPLRGSLFEPFVTGRADGTGLGLAIARELIAAQGGSLTLGGSGASDGAVFVVRLPAG